MGGVETLDLSGTLNWDEVKAIVQSPSLAGLRTLDISNCGLTAGNVHALLQLIQQGKWRLPALSTLILDNNPIGSVEQGKKKPDADPGKLLTKLAHALGGKLSLERGTRITGIRYKPSGEGRGGVSRQRP